MNAATFDTLKATKKLRSAGYEEDQAESIIEILNESREDLLSIEQYDTQTKVLIANFDSKFTAIDSKISVLESKMDSKFSIMQWMLGFLLAGVTTLVLKSIQFNG